MRETNKLDLHVRRRGDPFHLKELVSFLKRSWHLKSLKDGPNFKHGDEGGKNSKLRTT